MAATPAPGRPAPADQSTVATKTLKLRWPGTCVVCTTELGAGTSVLWDSDAKTATCGSCAPTPEPSAPEIDRGIAGASARRRYERDSERERRRKEATVARDAEWRTTVVDEHPIIGRIATVLTPKPVVGPESTAIRNWDKGAKGEELVGPVLEACPGVVVLHDRRVPKSKANIDHLVVGPSGIYVVDPKNYEGTLERRTAGTFFRPEARLYVGGRNQTKLVDGVLWQMSEVRKALGDDPMPIYGILCFVGPNWRRFFTRPLHVNGVAVMWPSKAAEEVQQPGPFDADKVTAVAALLAARLRPA